jgi:hypothetical protein
MRLPLAIALCLAASQAVALPAVPHLPPSIRDVTIDTPIPKRFQSGPWLWPPPFDGRYEAVLLSQRDWAVMGAHRRCDKPGQIRAGCTTIIKGRCWPFVRNAPFEFNVQQAMRHEIAHCRGWRH